MKIFKRVNFENRVQNSKDVLNMYFVDVPLLEIRVRIVLDISNMLFGK